MQGDQVPHIESGMDVEIIDNTKHSQMAKILILLFLHLFKCLCTVLEEIHLKQVVLFELLEVFPELFLLNWYLIVAV